MMWESSLWRFDPIWAGAIVALALLHEAAVRSLRLRFPDSAAARKKQRIAFLSGLVLFYAAVGSPVGTMADHSFLMHLLRQSLLLWLVPPLLLLGTPPGILRPLFQKRLLKGMLSFLTHPLIALFLFNAGFAAYYFPPVFDALAVRPLAANLAQVALILAAFLMWWPVFCPVPERDRLSELQKLLYITAGALLLTPVSVWWVFSGQPLYGAYADVPSLFPSLDLLEEQTISGAWIKFLQMFVYGSVFSYWFFRWVRRERRKEEKKQKAVERETVARLLLNERYTPMGTSRLKRKPSGNAPGKVVSLSEWKRKR